MKKPNWIISENEKSRILNLHQKATKSHYLKEQTNEPRTESIVVDLDAKWGDGKYIINPDQEKNLQQKLVQIADFVAKNVGSTVKIQIESSESQVTNYDREKYPIKKNKKDYDESKKLDRGVLSTYRANAIIEYLKKYFQGLNMNNVEFPQPIIKIGTTPYTKPEDKKTNAQKYESERYVRAIISLEKTYDCLVGLNITIGYYKDKCEYHYCDLAIFEIRMNGVPIGEVNLNNSQNDVKPKDEYFKSIVDQFAKMGRLSDGKGGGDRSQAFQLDDTKAKQIMSSSQQNKILISIKPLVGEGAKYEKFYTRSGSGNHTQVPWVTITNKENKILFNGLPNANLQRGSMQETVILVTDKCGNILRDKT